MDSLQNEQLIIRSFIGDNPKRAQVREALCHSAKFACEYCTNPAERFIINKGQNEDLHVTIQTQLQNIEQQILNLENEPSTSANDTNDQLTYLINLKKKLIATEKKLESLKKVI